MPDQKSLSKELLKSFFLAFKRLSFYAVGHPLSTDILSNLFKMFDVLLQEEREIFLVVGLNVNEVLVNKDVFGRETLGASEIYAKFKAFKIDGAGFVRGLTFDELVEFVRAMAAPSFLDGGKAAPLSELLRSGSEHIKIKKIRYERVEEGQKVVGSEVQEGAGASAGGKEGEGASGAAGTTGARAGGPGGEDVSVGAPATAEPHPAAPKIAAQIKDFLTGRSAETQKENAEILEEMEGDTQAVADAVIESIRESGDFETVIRRFVHWLSKRLGPVLIEKKREPEKFIDRFFDVFRKAEFGVASEDRDRIVEECADDIKMSLIAEAYFSKKGASRKPLNLAARILSEEDDQRRILPKLVQHLETGGASSEEARAFAQKIELELAKDEDVFIPKKKLQKLLRISERFDEELERRFQLATEELRRANRRLADEKERSEGVMRHLAEGLVVVDKTGRILMLNPAAEKLLNREAKESVGRSLVEGLGGEHLLAVAKGPLDDNDETHIIKEIELQSKDESTKRVLRASSAVVENEAGNMVGMVSVLSDITREKEIEGMKSHFVSLVTHELRTPVVAIQKSLELILSRTTGEINKDQEKFLDISKSNLERLSRLINDLLDMSKLEAGRLAILRSTFDFREVVIEVKASLQSWADDKKIALRIDMKDEPADVTADRDRILQVLVNLVGNALKFTPSGGEVVIVVRSLEEKVGVCQGPCLEVAVEDTGIGIDPKDFMRIFNKFEQVSLVSPPSMGGTGLGLPIAKEIVTLHGGTIWVESQKAKGSRFVFVIPTAPPKKASSSTDSL